ncbi:MAG: sigma-70 factor domain-containing protein, partial [Crocosphaera sp.]
MTKIPDEIGSYLKMIGRVPMLKDAEEIELGQQVK